MAVSPGVYNITLQRRADYYVRLQFKDSTGTAIDLTGWTVEAQSWDENRNKKYVDFAVAYTDRTAGTVSISLTDAQTETLPVLSYYDVLLTNVSGVKEYYLEGKITSSEGYTA